MRQSSVVTCLAMTSLVTAAPAGAQNRQRACFTQAEARDAVAAHHLADAFEAMRLVGAQMRADPVGGQLCRWDGDFVYEITLLRHDGRVIHAFLDGVTGKVMATRNDKDRPSKDGKNDKDH
jgi:uncharacterized membrane protein YkoI